MALILRLCQKQFLLHNVQVRCVTTKKNRIKMSRDKKVGPTIDASAKSLAAKGFLRPQKAYCPPTNVTDQLDKIYAQTFPQNDHSQPLSIDDKVTFLRVCESELKHSVPNALLHTINCLSDVKTFYETPVNTTLPLDAITNLTQDLPKNLHIQYEYHRFHPDTDTMFNGESAFPESSTIVTGLKSRQKYTGFQAKKAWLK